MRIVLCIIVTLMLGSLNGCSSNPDSSMDRCDRVRDYLPTMGIVTADFSYVMTDLRENDFSPYGQTYEGQAFNLLRHFHYVAREIHPNAIAVVWSDSDDTLWVGIFHVDSPAQDPNSHVELVKQLKLVDWSEITNTLKQPGTKT